MHVLVNQKQFQILDQRDEKIKGNVPTFRFAHYTFGIDEERVRKCKGISNSTRNNRTIGAQAFGEVEHHCPRRTYIKKKTI